MVPNEEISLNEEELRRLLEQPICDDDGHEPGEVGVEGSDGASPNAIDADLSDSPDDSEEPVGAPATTQSEPGPHVALGQDTIDQLLAQARGDASTPASSPGEVSGSLATAKTAPAPAVPKRDGPRPTVEPKAPVTVQPVQFSPLGAAAARRDKGPTNDLGILLDVPLRITVELGRAEMPVREILALGPGSVIELDRSAGEVLDVLVNGTLVAQGEVVVVDEQFGIRLTHVFAPNKDILEGMGAE